MAYDDDVWATYKKSVTPIKNCNKTLIQKKQTLGNLRLDRKIRNTEEVILPTKTNHKVFPMKRQEIRKVMVESVLDLHGMTRSDIDKVLRKFCLKCMKYNKKYVSIITGKGTGIVKEEFLKWISNSSEIVISISPVKDTNLGVGSYILRLRNLSKK